jgi:hypothetical protein
MAGFPPRLPSVERRSSHVGFVMEKVALFNVENVNLRGYNWNKTVSNRFCNVSDKS